MIKRLGQLISDMGVCLMLPGLILSIPGGLLVSLGSKMQGIRYEDDCDCCGYDW